MEGIHPPIRGNVPLKYWKYEMQSYLEQKLASPSKNLNITTLYGENISYWINRMQCDEVTVSCTKPCISIQKTNVYNYYIYPLYLEGMHPLIQTNEGVIIGQHQVEVCSVTKSSDVGHIIKPHLLEVRCVLLVPIGRFLGVCLPHTRDTMINVWRGIWNSSFVHLFDPIIRCDSTIIYLLLFWSLSLNFVGVVFYFLCLNLEKKSTWNGGIQPETWQDGIIYTPQWSIVAKIWPNGLVQVTG